MGFRPPVGMANGFVHLAARRLGLPVIGWSARGYDGLDRDSARVTERLLAHFVRGDVCQLPAHLRARLRRGLGDGRRCVRLCGSDALAGALHGHEFRRASRRRDPAHGGATPELDRALNLYWHWFRDQLTAWQDLVEHFYDGRIFAIHRAGSAFSQNHPGIVSRLLERHTAKHFSGMASGALTARPYSRGLLRFLGRHFARGSEPGLFAIR